MKQSLTIKTGQQLAMTPALRQGIELLNLPSQEIKAKIQETLDSNIMLEEEVLIDDAFSETGKKMILAMEMIKKQDPELQVQAPIRADAALIGDIRRRVLPYSKLIDDANLLMIKSLKES